MSAMIHLGCAGWAIGRKHVEYFGTSGTHLTRYSERFNAVEINSSFYRPHRQETYARWADSTPENFRFSVKIPKAITHEAGLEHCEKELNEFLGQVSFLGTKLGAMLIQLPPRFEFDQEVVRAFLDNLRDRFAGDIVCEPRHATWFTPEAEAVLQRYRIARVAADPAPHPGAADPGAWQGVTYFRLHGSPRMYYSSYDAPYIECVVRRLEEYAKVGPVWCIFDNTALGAATENAIAIQSILASRMLLLRREGA